MLATAYEHMLILVRRTVSFRYMQGLTENGIDEVMDAIGAECATIRQHSIDTSEINKAREYVLGVRALRQEGTVGIAMKNMHAYIRGGAVEDEEQYTARINAVTAEEVQHIANNILKPDAMAVCYVGNATVDPEVTDTFLRTLQ